MSDLLSTGFATDDMDSPSWRDYDDDCDDCSQHRLLPIDNSFWMSENVSDDHSISLGSLDDDEYGFSKTILCGECN